MVAPTVLSDCANYQFLTCATLFNDAFPLGEPNQIGGLYDGSLIPAGAAPTGRGRAARPGDTPLPAELPELHRHHRRRPNPHRPAAVGLLAAQRAKPLSCLQLQPGWPAA